MKELRQNIAKKRLYEGKTVTCFALWGYAGSDHIERLAPIKPHAIWMEGEHGNVDFAYCTTKQQYKGGNQ